MKPLGTPASRYDWYGFPITHRTRQLVPPAGIEPACVRLAFLLVRSERAYEGRELLARIELAVPLWKSGGLPLTDRSINRDVSLF